MKSVGIIGAGATGFAAARALAAENPKYRIVLFDRHSQPGGVWIYTGSGPMYRNLDTNIFKQLMEYKDRPFPSHLPTYPDRSDVHNYLIEYGQEIGSHEHVEVKYETEVNEVKKDGIKWSVTFKCKDGTQSTEHFDFIVVASGHYDDPFYPAIIGLDQLLGSKDPKITHSRYYDSPDKYRDKKVLVVGNAASGVDIVIQLRSVTTQISVSRRHESKSDVLFNEDVTWKPQISEIHKNTVAFEDGSSETFDAVLFATGYKHKLSFLEKYSQGCSIPVTDPKELRVQNLHKYIFYINDSSLAFVGLNKNVVPMPLSECQSAVISAVWSKRLNLPSVEEMLEEEKQLVAEKGSGKSYFVMGYPEDVKYMHFLNDWAESNPGGFLAEKWCEEKCKLRSEVADAKLSDYSRKLKQSRETYKHGHAKISSQLLGIHTHS